jgi:hypothetical protein
MTLQVDHVFVCTSTDASEAEALVAAGLVEGSPNTHPGQGTANRRFFFENGFLELLWVRDEREARSALTAPTRLWDRWVGRGKSANPFGICFSSPQGAEAILPFASRTYRPRYLSAERFILFADEPPLSEPELFALSWPQVRSHPSEPKSHPLGLRAMRSVSVGLPNPTSISGPLGAIRDLGLVKLHRSATPELCIEFTSRQEVQLDVPALALTMIGRPGATA